MESGSQPSKIASAARGPSRYLRGGGRYSRKRRRWLTRSCAGNARSLASIELDAFVVEAQERVAHRQQAHGAVHVRIVTKKTLQEARAHVQFVRFYGVASQYQLFQSGNGRKAAKGHDSAEKNASEAWMGGGTLACSCLLFPRCSSFK